ncbi:MAG: hypothetical protein KDK37_06755 [Leptospiraceae bacterium]|nr:hypothetical protein [Leptospiraceae bacterium]MCB1303957.1 hypothetical protein [Leptospiraceae bacterium]
MKAQELREKLEEPGQSFRLGSVIQSVAADARENVETMQALEDLLQDCSDPDFWRTDGRWASTLFHTVVRVGNSRSMMLLLSFARRLPEDFPFGPVDLLGNILPLYGHIMIGPAKELVQENASSACLAVGVQTLCQLYLDGAIYGENMRYLQSMIDDFESDSYLSQNIIELVKNSMQRNVPENVDIDPDDVLVQMSD